MRKVAVLGLICVALAVPAVGQPVRWSTDADLAKGEDTAEATAVIPIPPENDAKNFAGDDTLWLHVRVKGECSFLYAKHEHEAYVTRGAKDGPRKSIDRIVLHNSIGGDRQDKTCRKTSGCGRTEHEFNLGCRRSCVAATATHAGYGSWDTRTVCIW